jgi:hypothetical protein
MALPMTLRSTAFLPLLTALACNVATDSAATDAEAIARSAKVDVCHQQGNGDVHMINISVNALDAHLTNHGDSLPTDWYTDSDGDGYGESGDTVTACTAPAGTAAVDGDCDDSDDGSNPDAAEVCGDGIDNNCDGQADEGCTEGCGPLLDSFSDDFTGSDGTLGADWAGFSDLIPDAYLSNNEACGTSQSLALLDHCLVDMESTTISFDWRPDSSEGQEAWAMVVEDTETDPPTNLYILGCDGGYNSPIIEGGMACGLDILNAFGDEVANGGTYMLVPGTTYHMEATITAAGAMSVTLSDAGGVIGTTSGSVSGGVDVNAVGFIVGRDETSTTCADNFDFTTD